MVTTKEELIRLRKELVARNETHEIQTLLRFLELTYEDVKDAIVEMQPDHNRLLEMRGSAKMLRDLLKTLKRPVAPIQPVEMK